MDKKYLLLPFLIILIFSCESKLYPPTDPPVLSDLVLTSSSYNSSTTKTYKGDTVFLIIAVEDPEEDPETLTLSIISEGTELASEEYGESRIHDESSWEGWFETSDLTVGNYTLNFTATDKEGNISETLSQSFSIETNIKSTVSTDEILLTVSDPPTLAGDDTENPEDPFKILYTVTNNSSVTIDTVHTPFTVNITWTDPDTAISETVIYKGVGITSDIAPATEVASILKLNIQNTAANVYDSMTYDEADCTITIY